MDDGEAIFQSRFGMISFGRDGLILVRLIKAQTRDVLMLIGYCLI